MLNVFWIRALCEIKQRYVFQRTKSMNNDSPHFYLHCAIQARGVGKSLKETNTNQERKKQNSDGNPPYKPGG